MPSEPTLPDAPDHPLTAGGAPLFGTYRGDLTTVGLDAAAATLLGRLGARRALKRWQWVGVFDDSIAFGAAIVSMGYASNIFGWVFDRRAGAFRWERQSNGLPGSVEVAATPRPGSVSRAGEELSVMRVTDTTWRISATWRDLALEVDARSVGVPMTAICPVDGLVDDPVGGPVGGAGSSAVHCTRKESGLRATGRIEWNGGSHRLAPDAFVMLDHSHGMTARRTSWRWVMAFGKDRRGIEVGLNCVAGFNDGLENVAWIDGEPHAIGKVNITFHPEHPGEPWLVYNDDLELELRVEGVRSHDVNLGLVASRYDQPIGVWSGNLLGRQVELVGVAEDHFALW